MSGYFRAPRALWPSVAEALPHPWLDEWVALDCAYWAGEAEREAKGYRSALPTIRGQRRLSRPWCAQRWGWSQYQAAQALRRLDPMAALSTASRQRVDSESTGTARAKRHNGRKIDSESTVTRQSVNTCARLGTDHRLQTTDLAPLDPPEGAADPDMISAVRRGLAVDPRRLTDEQWCDSHGLAACYHLAIEQGEHATAETLLDSMLADRPGEPMRPEEVLAVMRAQGWRGSGRLRDIKRTIETMERG